MLYMFWPNMKAHYLYMCVCILLYIYAHAHIHILYYFIIYYSPLCYERIRKKKDKFVKYQASSGSRVYYNCDHICTITDTVQM